MTLGGGSERARERESESERERERRDGEEMDRCCRHR